MPDEKIQMARTKFAEEKMEVLVAVLDRLDNDDSSDLSKLARKCGMSVSQLRLHHRYADHWRNHADDSYNIACLSLEAKLYGDIKTNVKQKLKAMKSRAGKQSSLNLILNLIEKCPPSD